MKLNVKTKKYGKKHATNRGKHDRTHRGKKGGFYTGFSDFPFSPKLTPRNVLSNRSSLLRAQKELEGLFTPEDNEVSPNMLQIHFLKNSLDFHIVYGFFINNRVGDLFEYETINMQTIIKYHHPQNNFKIEDLNNLILRKFLGKYLTAFIKNNHEPQLQEIQSMNPQDDMEVVYLLWKLTNQFLREFSSINVYFDKKCVIGNCNKTDEMDTIELQKINMLQDFILFANQLRTLDNAHLAILLHSICSSEDFFHKLQTTLILNQANVFPNSEIKSLRFNQGIAEPFEKTEQYLLKHQNSIKYQFDLKSKGLDLEIFFTNGSNRPKSTVNLISFYNHELLLKQCSIFPLYYYETQNSEPLIIGMLLSITTTNLTRDKVELFAKFCWLIDKERMCYLCKQQVTEKFTFLPYVPILPEPRHTTWQEYDDEASNNDNDPVMEYDENRTTFDGLVVPRRSFQSEYGEEQDREYPLLDNKSAAILSEPKNNREVEPFESKPYDIDTMSSTIISPDSQSNSFSGGQSRKKIKRVKRTRRKNCKTNKTSKNCKKNKKV
jgi:hypothetical protein